MVTLKVRIIITVIQTKKNKRGYSIYQAKFSKYSKFNKNPLQGNGNMGP